MNFVRLVSFVIVFLLIGASAAQTSHNITVTNVSFSPTPLTITTGDTVRWIAVLGTHNVLADDGSFTSGPPAPAPWEFTHVFTTAGSNPYYCEPHGGPGGTGMSGVIIVEDPVSVPEKELFVNEFRIEQNYPNPFNPSTKISFNVPQESFVKVKVYDIIGNEITTLVNEVKSAGYYEVEFVAENLSSGIYIYQLRANDFIQTKKMILLR